MKQSISLPHVDSQHIRGEIAGRRSGQNTLKVKQSRQSSKMVCWSLVTRGYTHIFLHILRFDGLIRGVRRVERPKGKAAKKADKTGSEEGASAREHGLWVLTDTSQTHSQLPHSSHICSELLWNTKGRHVLEQSECLCGFNPHGDATKEVLGSDLSKQSGLIMSRNNVMESGRLQWAKMEKTHSFHQGWVTMC